MAKKRKPTHTDSPSDSTEGMETVSYFSYLDGRGRNRRIKVIATHHERYDLRLLAQALVMVSQDLAKEQAENDAVGKDSTEEEKP